SSSTVFDGVGAFEVAELIATVISRKGTTTRNRNRPAKTPSIVRKNCFIEGVGVRARAGLWPPWTIGRRGLPSNERRVTGEWPRNRDGAPQQKRLMTAGPAPISAACERGPIAPRHPGPHSPCWSP